MDEIQRYLLNAGVFWIALASMEVVAIFTHKYVMHGWLWILHRSHHEQHKGLFEWNDLFAVFFSLPSIALIAAGYPRMGPAFWGGLGIAAYGLLYFLLHDVLVHKRIPHHYLPTKGYMRRILHAHRLHHAIRTKEGAVSFGFVYAPKVAKLRARMKELESLTGNAPAYKRG